MKEDKRVGAAPEKRQPSASRARPERGEALKGGEGEEPERAGPAQKRPGVGAGKRLRAEPAGDEEPAAAEEREKAKRLEPVGLP